jgi:hypothetical protein
MDEVTIIVCKNNSALGCCPEQLKIIIGIAWEAWLRCARDIVLALYQCLA